MNQWELIRLRCMRDNEPIMHVAKDLAISENTIRKYLRSDIPPTKIITRRSSILDPFQPLIDEYLKNTPKITSRRIGVLLKERHGLQFKIGECMLRRYIARRRQRIVPAEAFLRAEYAPGDQSQFDFSPMIVRIAGSETVIQLFVMRLSYSGHFFARASYREDRPALFKGILEALTFFGGMPNVSIFDNAKTAVQKVLRGQQRVENTEFQAFRGALALEVQFAAPAKGNEKGGVEGLHGYIEDNFFRPIPEYSGIEDLNAALRSFSTNDMQRQHTTHGEKIIDRFAREQPLLRPLPQHVPRPVITTSVRINKFSEISVDTNAYSVPTKYAFRQATVEISDGHIMVFIDGILIAEHQRSHLRKQSIINPLHYLDILQRKHRSATRAFALAHGRVPDALQRLYQRLEQDDVNSATKKWTRVLALGKNYPLEAVAQAAEKAMARGSIDGDAIEMILRQKVDDLPVLHINSPSNTAIHMQRVGLEGYAITNMIERAA
jgi:transposase